MIILMDFEPCGITFCVNRLGDVCNWTDEAIITNIQADLPETDFPYLRFGCFLTTVGRSYLRLAKAQGKFIKGMMIFTINHVWKEGLMGGSGSCGAVRAVINIYICLFAFRATREIILDFCIYW